MGIDYIQEKLENKLSLSRVCIIEEAFKDLTVILVTDRTSKIRYAIVKLFFKKAFVVDFTNGIMRSSLVKGVGDVILTHCSCLTESMKKKILSLVDKGKRR